MSDILQSVLSTILENMITAQDEANMRSAQLAEKYIGFNSNDPNDKDKLLQFYDVPYASIKSFDLNLKFGLDSNLITDEIRDNLSKYINESITEFAEKYPFLSLAQVNDVFHKLWREEEISNFDMDLINDCRLLIKVMKKDIKELTDSTLLIGDNPGFKAILDVNDLNGINDNILCSININAEMIGKKAGFRDEANNIESNNNRKIILV